MPASKTPKDYAADSGQAIDTAAAPATPVANTTDDAKLGTIASKWKGKTGTVTSREDGGGAWTVTFKGRNGGAAIFSQDQMDLVQGVAA